MDNEFEMLEAELKGLRPAAPSRALVARVERTLGAKDIPEAVSPLRWLWIAALPVAAAITVMVMQFSPRSESAGASVANLPSPVASTELSSSSEALLKPVTAENLLVSARDEGLVTLDDGTQARREHRQYIDTITWKNPRTHASLTWSVPREEILVVPVIFQ